MYKILLYCFLTLTILEASPINQARAEIVTGLNLSSSYCVSTGGIHINIRNYCGIYFENVGGTVDEVAFKNGIISDFNNLRFIDSSQEYRFLTCRFVDVEEVGTLRSDLYCFQSKVIKSTDFLTAYDEYSVPVLIIRYSQQDFENGIFPKDAAITSAIDGLSNSLLSDAGIIFTSTLMLLATILSLIVSIMLLRRFITGAAQ